MCPKPHNDDYTNMYTMNIKQATGVYHCFRCASKGNWYDFKDKVMQRFYGKSLEQLVSDGSGIGERIRGALDNPGMDRFEAVNAKYD